MEMAFGSWGGALGRSAPNLAAPAGTINQTLNVDLGKLSQGE